MKTALITVDTSKSLSANYTSPPIYLDQNYTLAIQAIFIGSPVGTFTLQTSLDYAPGGALVGSVGIPINAGTWATYPNSSQTSSGVNTCFWDITATGARWFQVLYTSTSGTGTLTKLLAQTKG